MKLHSYINVVDYAYNIQWVLVELIWLKFKADSQFYKIPQN